jgi:hypothetical protein
MKNLNLLSKISLMFLVLLLLSSCYESCVPAFPDDLAKWLPYEGVSKIEFISEDDSVLSFEITNYDKSEKVCYDTRYLYAPPHPKLELTAIDTIANFSIDCNLYKYSPITHPDSAIVNPEPVLVFGIWSTKDIDNESVADIDDMYTFDELYSFDMYYQNENKTEEKKLFPVLDSLNIGGVTYKDVYQLCRYNHFESFTAYFVKAYIVKGIGIVGLEEADGTMWALKN